MSSPTDFATKKDVEIIVQKAVDDLSEVISALGSRMHEELVEVKDEIKDVEGAVATLTGTVDGLAGIIVDQKQENTARDIQFKRHLQWSDKVAVKVEIPLGN